MAYKQWTDRLLLKNGGRFEFWISHLGVIEEFVAKYKIPRFDMEHYAAHHHISYMSSEIAENDANELRYFDIRPFPGGRPFPDLRPFPGMIMPMRFEKEKNELKYILPKPFPGGLRIPHLHLRDDIYILDQRQWADFTSTALDNFRARLDSIKSVDFDKLMELSEAIDTCA